MGALANIFETAGLATVSLSLVRELAEKARPPRALHCNFPLGRPLGRPGDAAFQHRVLSRALALLHEPSGPVLQDFDVRIDEQSEVPASCPLPPRDDRGDNAAVAEVKGLRAAFERTRNRRGTTDVARATDPDGIVAAVELLARIADAGSTALDVSDVRPPGLDLALVAQDIRSYYEEAALSLLDHAPAARQTETWFFQHTLGGDVVHRAQRALKNGGADAATWQYMLPFTQRRRE